MTFDDAFERLIGHEGGYTNNPADPGGETMYGVTLNVARQYGYAGAMKDLTLAQAKDIAKRGYWDACGADKFVFPLAFQLFDAAYNHGPGRAVKFLQLAVGAVADGVLGPKTIAAVVAVGVPQAVLLFNAERLEFYTGLPTWNTFGKGWARRVAANLQYGATDK